MLDKGRCLSEGTLADVTCRGEVVSWLLGPGSVPLEGLREELLGYRLELAQVGEDQVLVQHSPRDGDLDAASLLIGKALIKAAIAIRGVQRGHRLEESYLDLHEE